MISSNVFSKLGIDQGAQLPSYTSIGCYPIVYLTRREHVLCAECASTTEEQVSDGDVHWEGDSHFCEDCDCEIASAYGNE